MNSFAMPGSNITATLTSEVVNSDVVMVKQEILKDDIQDIISSVIQPLILHCIFCEQGFSKRDAVTAHYAICPSRPRDQSVPIHRISAKEMENVRKKSFMDTVGLVPKSKADDIVKFRRTTSQDMIETILIDSSSESDENDDDDDKNTRSTSLSISSETTIHLRSRKPDIPQLPVVCSRLPCLRIFKSPGKTSYSSRICRKENTPVVPDIKECVQNTSKSNTLIEKKWKGSLKLLNIPLSSLLGTRLPTHLFQGLPFGRQFARRHKEEGNLWYDEFCKKRIDVKEHSNKQYIVTGRKLRFRNLNNSNTDTRHVHKYKFNSRQRKEFMRVARTGLNDRARRQLSRMKPCSVTLWKLNDSAENKVWSNSGLLACPPSRCPVSSISQISVGAPTNTCASMDHSFGGSTACSKSSTDVKCKFRGSNNLIKKTINVCQVLPMMAKSDSSARSPVKSKDTLDSSCLTGSISLKSNPSEQNDSCHTTDSHLSKVAIELPHLGISLTKRKATDEKYSEEINYSSSKKIRRLSGSIVPKLTFSCNICSNVINCSFDSALMIRNHYKEHGICNIDVREEKQPDGKIVMNIVELKPSPSTPKILDRQDGYRGKSMEPSILTVLTTNCSSNFQYPTRDTLYVPDKLSTSLEGSYNGHTTTTKSLPSAIATIDTRVVSGSQTLLDNSGKNRDTPISSCFAGDTVAGEHSNDRDDVIVILDDFEESSNDHIGDRNASTSSQSIASEHDLSPVENTPVENFEDSQSVIITNVRSLSATSQIAWNEDSVENASPNTITPLVVSEKFAPILVEKFKRHYQSLATNKELMQSLATRFQITSQKRKVTEAAKPSCIQQEYPANNVLVSADLSKNKSTNGCQSSNFRNMTPQNSLNEIGNRANLIRNETSTVSSFTSSKEDSPDIIYVPEKLSAIELPGISRKVNGTVSTTAVIGLSSTLDKADEPGHRVVSKIKAASAYRRSFKTSATEVLHTIPVTANSVHQKNPKAGGDVTQLPSTYSSLSSSRDSVGSRSQAGLKPKLLSDPVVVDDICKQQVSSNCSKSVVGSKHQLVLDPTQKSFTEDLYIWTPLTNDSSIVGKDKGEQPLHVETQSEVQQRNVNIAFNSELPVVINSSMSQTLLNLELAKYGSAAHKPVPSDVNTLPIHNKQQFPRRAPIASQEILPTSPVSNVLLSSSSDFIRSQSHCQKFGAEQTRTSSLQTLPICAIEGLPSGGFSPMVPFVRTIHEVSPLVAAAASPPVTVEDRDPVVIEID